MYNPYAGYGQQSTLQSLQQNPMYNGLVQNQYPVQRQQFQQPVMQQPQQAVMPPQQNQMVQSSYDFIGKRVTSYEEVKAAPVPIDGKPMIFIDDENDKLYFKFITPSGEQTLQSFNITTTDPVAPLPIQQEPMSAQLPTNSFVSVEEFNTLKTEFENLKKELN